MKIYIKLLMVMVLGAVWLVPLQAQKNLRELNGNITDFDGHALAGAVVSGDDGAVKTVSDAAGNFFLKIASNEPLVFRKEGYVTRIIGVNDFLADPSVSLDSNLFHMGDEDLVNVPFGAFHKRRLSGSVYAIDADRFLEYDNRISLGEAINGNVPGVFNQWNLFGTGDAVVVVDGIPREAADFDLFEVDQISVLKDPVSRMMYGAQAQQGVILVTTKRGEAFNRQRQIRVETGIQAPRRMPEFLDGAEYMEMVNLGRLNDGLLPTYSGDQIDGTRLGADPLRFPNEDYVNTFVRSNVKYQNVRARFSGGSSKGLYFVNAGWSNNEGWMKDLGEGGESTNTFNVRANTSYQVTDNLKMTLDGVALLKLYEAPNLIDYNNTTNEVTSDFWKKVYEREPIRHPFLIPLSAITDQDQEIIRNAKLIDGKYLLGGNNSYTNSLYGDMTQGQDRKELERVLQYNAGLEWDMGFITEGLRANGYISFDLYNKFVVLNENEYAVYEPVFLDESQGGGIDSLKMWNLDKPTGRETANHNQSRFRRRIGAFGTLNYDRVFGDHTISATALAYRDQKSETLKWQDTKNLHFGLRTNYMFQNKYVAELSGTMIGSQKLSTSERWGFSPAVGLGWIISEEGFMDGSFLDYLKVKGTIGILKNDNWDDYYIYSQLFANPTSNEWFEYNNTSGHTADRNKILEYVSAGSNIGFQTNREITLGFEASLVNNKFWFEAGYFNVEVKDQMTQMENFFPLIMGGLPYYNNFNAFSHEGVEAGLRFSETFGDLKFKIGGNMIYAMPKVSKIDEPVYSDNQQYRYRAGRASDAIWGYVADGLYGPDDFDEAGALMSELPKPTFGNVQPGDVKYIDVNKDGVIDNADQKVIGNNSPRVQYSVNLTVEYKKFQLYVLGIGQAGQERLRNDAYYRSFGFMNHSVEARKAYGPGNEDVNAEIPRLSASRVNNNYLTSTYWMYSNNTFTLPTIQLAYNFGKVANVFSDVNLYLRGWDLVKFGKNLEYSEINVARQPAQQGGAIGVTMSF